MLKTNKHIYIYYIHAYDMITDNATINNSTLKPYIQIQNKIFYTRYYFQKINIMYLFDIVIFNFDI